MKDTFAIQVIDSEKWLNLDYSTGSEIIYVDSFIDAYLFKTEKEVIDFMCRNFLNIDEYELYKLDVFAKPIQWNLC